MTGRLLMVAAVAAALVDWWMVSRDRRAAERVTKPLTMALLVGVAATWGEPSGDVRAWLVVGAVLGLVGDIALLGDGEREFLTGLVAFACGHVAYAVAALAIGGDWSWALVGVVVMALLLGFRFLTRIVPGAGRDGAPMAVAVVVYGLLIATMTIATWATAGVAGRTIVAGVGATLFAISDWVLGHERFVGPLPGRRLNVRVPYHVGQALLIVGLAG